MVPTAVADQFFHSLCAAARVDPAGEDNCTQHPRGDHTPRPLTSNSVKSETYTGIEGCRKERSASNAGQFLQTLPVLAPSGRLETCYLFSHESPPVGWLPRLFAQRSQNLLKRRFNHCFNRRVKPMCGSSDSGITPTRVSFSETRR